MRTFWAAVLVVVALPGAAVAATFQPDLASLPAVPRHELSADAVQHAIAGARMPPGVQRYAVGLDVGLKLADGRWEPVDATTSRWRTHVRSPGAVSMSALLAPVSLPAGAQLWIYGTRGQRAFGPYTQADVGKSGVWTPVVRGDDLVVEVRSPAAAAGGVQLGLAKAFHGYGEIGKAGLPGQSGACNVDAACQAATWGTEERSVAMITIANQYYCTGQLVNNVNQDFKAFFLTARHCGVNRENGPADSVNFYFNYQAAHCGDAAQETSESPAMGSVWLADDRQSDFSLLRITGTLPSNVYFAGWNATGTGATSGAAIHHPQGDDKKISLFETPAAQGVVDIGTGCIIDAWQVQWASGTTEQGSSGAGLWTSGSHQLIGVLSGGFASCANPGGSDYFARLDRGWTAQTASTGQLKFHLAAGTCIASVPGLDPQGYSVDNPPSPITEGPQRCEGVLSDGSCERSGGGGGSAGSLLPGLLVALLARRRRK